jgi:SPX domain protein involved in polyphosphate accumulation
MGDWLGHVCAPDPNYPCNGVNSLYYDTAGLDLCAAKESSDFLKAKIRVRWYDEAGPTEPIFLEAKMKEGVVVHKERIRLEDGGEALCGMHADDEALRFLQAQAQALVPFPLGMLHPVCIVTYRRSRYIDPVTGWRVSLDEGICLPASNTDLFPFSEAAYFDFCVLEVKGRGRRPNMTPHLLPHPDITVLPETFSKYYEGVEALKLTGVPI